MGDAHYLLCDFGRHILASYGDVHKVWYGNKDVKRTSITR